MVRELGHWTEELGEGSHCIAKVNGR